ncbi:MAG: DUF3108 domain-containing protein [Xanthomonadales bacterium]|nr:DUF3108 domain-containing protein [Xanthomonadales bacterium]
MNSRTAALSVWLASLALLPAGPARSESMPEPVGFDLHYQVFRNDKLQGKAQLSLQPDGAGTWLLTMQVKADRGLASFVGYEETERSRLAFQDNGQWRVLGYRRDRAVGWRKRHEQVDFDWSQGRVRADVDGEHFDLAVESGLADPNSVLLRLAADLHQGLQPGQYPVLRRGKVDQWQFRQTGRETLGDREVVVVERVRDHGRRTTTSWLAPSLGYMPARIQQVEEDETLRLELIP